MSESVSNNSFPEDPMDRADPVSPWLPDALPTKLPGEDTPDPSTVYLYYELGLRVTRSGGLYLSNYPSEGMLWEDDGGCGY